jgi:electron transfer flavoprotein alpha subunit
MVSSLYSLAEESKEIWVYLEQEAGVLENVSLELLSKGRQMADYMGWQLTGLLIGSQVAHLVRQVFAHRADRVWQAEHPLLEHFTIDAYARVACQALMQGKPSVFLLGATHDGRDLAARLAVRLRTGLNADCTDLRLDSQGDLLVSEVSGFGGGVLALIEMRHHRPQMATVRPGVFQIQEKIAEKTGEVINIPVELSEDMIRTRIVERRTSGSVDLTRTPVLVAGGRGMGADFSILERLAAALEGDVGATRPPVDMGYIERERQIGQTGVVCSPKLAICCGISGAFHFVVGIEKAETVIAINSDPDAPIFEYADYCVVGDVHKFIPALIQALHSVPEMSHA